MPYYSSHAAEIMPVFEEQVQPGDEITLGLSDDPTFPPEYRGSDRPVLTVTDVKHIPDEFGGGTVTYASNMETGEDHVLNSNSMSPHHAWEFTSDGFERVMNRLNGYRSSHQSGGDDAYRSALIERVEDLSRQMQNQGEAFQNFANTTLEVVNSIAGDVAPMVSDGFCHTFRGEFAQASPSADNAEVPNYQSTMMDINSLEGKVSYLENNLYRQTEEMKSFQGNMVDALYHVAEDIGKIRPGDDTFSSSYRSLYDSGYGSDPDVE